MVYFSHRYQFQARAFRAPHSIVIIIIFSILSLFTWPIFGKTPEAVVLQSEQQVTSITHNLNDGSTLPVLNWAWKKKVECFPEKSARWFQGNHRYYIVSIPEYTDAHIELLSKDGGVSISLFAYILPSGSTEPLPPRIDLVPWCKSVHDTEYEKSQTKSIDMKSHERSYNLVIGVAGASLTFQGEYDLSISMIPRLEPSITQSIPVTNIEREEENKLFIRGDLELGVIIPIQWANQPEIACFPGQMNPMFSGKHQFYRISMHAFERLNITAIPLLLETDVSIYAYKVPSGQDSPPLPPEVKTKYCVSSGGFRKKNPGVPETVKFHTGVVAEDVIIGVTSPVDESSGEFALRFLFEKR